MGAKLTPQLNNASIKRGERYFYMDKPDGYHLNHMVAIALPITAQSNVFLMS